MKLLDTSAIIKLLKDPQSSLAELASGDICISIISLAELSVGFRFVASTKNIELKRIFEALISRNSIRVLAVDTKVIEEYASLQADLLKKGQQLGQFDGLIAATAIVYDLTLVTQDKDYQRLKKLKVVSL